MPFSPNQGNDHVHISISLSVTIGIKPEEDELPSEFCDAVRNAIKSTGATITTSSIVVSKRKNALSNEALRRFLDTNNKHFLD